MNAENLTKTEVPAGFMQNAQGHLVPEDMVREQDKLRDSVVNDLARQAMHINSALAEFKKQALGDIKDLLQIAADRYEVKLGGKKGNVSLVSYNGQFKVQRNFAERITFTEEFEAAEKLFFDYLEELTSGTSNEVKVIIESAFLKTRTGQLRTGDLLKLLRLEIDHPTWKTACQALTDSMQKTGSAIYVRVYQRIADTDKYQLIPLDLASV